MQKPGCRVYVTTANGLQQYISDATSIAGWYKDSSIISYGSNTVPMDNTPMPVLNIVPMDNTPMTVLNTYDFGGNEISVFFVTSHNQVAYQTHINTSNFKLVVVPLTVTGTPKFMTSVVWKNADGSEFFELLPP